jgi:hypothetical protein
MCRCQYPVKSTLLPRFIARGHAAHLIAIRHAAVNALLVGGRYRGAAGDGGVALLPRLVQLVFRHLAFLS